MKKVLSLFIICSLIVVLAACGKTAEERIDIGLKNMDTVFKEEPKETNHKISNVELYLPSRYKIETTEDVNNFHIKKGSDVYILFVNTKVEEDSKLQYDILKNDTSKKIIKEKTMDKDGVFSFAAVDQQDEDNYELIVSSGGIKITTISEKKKIDEKLLTMMEILHSVKLIKE